MKLVSVIMPAFNASLYLAEALQSIVNQTYHNIEIILVDDGSTDDTAHIARSFSPKCKYIWRPNSGSCAAPRNTGLEKASGDLVTFFDADDVMAPDKIERQVRNLAAHPEAVMSILNYHNFTPHEQHSDHYSSCPLLSERLRDQVSDPVVLQSRECRNILLHENFGSACSPLFSTKLVREIGGFEETLKASEDFHLIYRMAAMGPVAVSRYIGFERRLHDVNMSADNERMLRNYVRCRTLLKDSENDHGLRNLLDERIRRAKRQLQDCLIRKGQGAEVLRLYRETLPPHSLNELKIDFKHMAKLILTQTGLRQSQPSRH